MVKLGTIVEPTYNIPRNSFAVLSRIFEAYLEISPCLIGKSDFNRSGILNLGFSCRCLNRSDYITSQKHILIGRFDSSINRHYAV
jgi:hypothetical protein